MRRGRRFIAWEYLFDFGGGAPPWMSGMAQATAIQALARAADLLEQPRYLETARRALGAFETLPPTGVRAVGPAGGIHYLQYSFAPRLWIFNAFLQSLIGLYDYSKATGDERARELFEDAEPEAREELPLSDLGDWSRYNYAGHESSPRLPRAAARVPPEHVLAPAGRALLHLRPALPRLSDRPAGARAERARADAEGRPDRDPVHASRSSRPSR